MKKSMIFPAVESSRREKGGKRREREKRDRDKKIKGQGGQP